MRAATHLSTRKAVARVPVGLGAEKTRSGGRARVEPLAEEEEARAEERSKSACARPRFRTSQSGAQMRARCARDLHRRTPREFAY